MDSDRFRTPEGGNDRYKGSFVIPYLNMDKTEKVLYCKKNQKNTGKQTRRMFCKVYIMKGGTDEL